MINLKNVSCRIAAVPLIAAVLWSLMLSSDVNAQAPSPADLAEEALNSEGEEPPAIAAADAG